MKVQYIKSYNQKFGNSYYSQNFLDDKKRPSEVDLVEDMTKQYIQTGQNISFYYVFHKIGRIFEEQTVYDKAIEFYNKAKNSLNPNSKSYKTKSENIDFDISRVYNKKSQLNGNWNV